MDLRISSPCPLKWDSLKGDDRVRFCGQCGLNVYNLVDMPDADVEALVLRTEGRLCGRLYLRGDRTATVRSCPGGAMRKRARALLAVGSLLLLGVASWILRTQFTPDRKTAPPIVQNLLDWIDPPAPRPEAPMGIVCPPRPPKPPPPPPLPIAPDSVPK